MGCIRPATPGFIVTLVATILLAVVSFCVPYFKTVYFLKANISIDNIQGSITFGTLGYCLELSNGTTCSKPSVGYELDINSLVGNKLPIQIPEVLVKWLTYALVLHVVALVLSAGSALFGLLAHVREMSMTCFSTCVSGFAAVVALLAFIFDLAFFFVAKSRINAVGSAEMGNAIWLTLAAFILLLFSGCFYTLGRCCYNQRKPRGDWDRRKEPPDPVSGGYEEQRRLDAVKAEADRKARQETTEGGLPAFYETQPLTARVEGDAVYADNYRDQHTSPSAAAAPGYGGGPSPNGGYAGGGYAQAPYGSRAVDEYYSPTTYNNTGPTYPPQPQNQLPATNHVAAASTHAPSIYAASTYTYAPTNPSTSPPPNQQYLSPIQQYPDRYGSPGHDYGHTAGGTTYHSAVSHPQDPTTYTQYDSYEPPQQPLSPNYAYHADPYNNAGFVANTTQHDRSYTLGGDSYGLNTLSPPLEHPNQNPGHLPYPGDTHHLPGPINTDIHAISPPQVSPVRGPRDQQTRSPIHYDDNPPGYEAAQSGAWGKH